MRASIAAAAPNVPSAAPAASGGSAYSCLFLALANLGQHRIRLVVALIGTAVPVVLLILQLAFLQGARFEVTRLYSDFEFDLAFLPQSYQFMLSNGTFNRVRLTEARAIAPIDGVYGLNVAQSYWIDNDTQRRSPALLIGVDSDESFVSDPEIREQLSLLNTNQTILADGYSSKDFGSLGVGTDAKLADRPVTVKGLYHLGLFFYADGSALVRNSDFPLFSGREPSAINVGFLRLSPGADPQAVKKQLAAAMPEDVRVVTHDELMEAEQGFFITTKPIGIMLWISMAIAFLVGAVILFQVLSTEMIARKKEFATFKAMGFGAGFVFGVGLLEAALLTFGAFVPGLAAGWGILAIVERTTHLPAGVTPLIALQVLLSVTAMSAFAVITVLRRISRANPADLCR